ncbi:hypothetical protein D3C87_1657870 [compost metagenome]
MMTFSIYAGSNSLRNWARTRAAAEARSTGASGCPGTGGDWDRTGCEDKAATAVAPVVRNVLLFTMLSAKGCSKPETKNKHAP